jgi:hypothetical protein
VKAPERRNPTDPYSKLTPTERAAWKRYLGASDGEIRSWQRYYSEVMGKGRRLNVWTEAGKK